MVAYVFVLVWLRSQFANSIFSTQKQQHPHTKPRMSVNTSDCVDICASPSSSRQLSRPMDAASSAVVHRLAGGKSSQYLTISSMAWGQPAKQNFFIDLLWREGKVQNAHKRKRDKNLLIFFLWRPQTEQKKKTCSGFSLPLSPTSSPNKKTSTNIYIYHYGPAKTAPCKTTIEPSNGAFAVTSVWHRSSIERTHFFSRRGSHKSSPFSWDPKTKNK